MNKEGILNIINNGAITLKSIQWYLDKGYILVIKNGKAVDIVKEEI